MIRFQGWPAITAAIGIALASAGCASSALAHGDYGTIVGTVASTSGAPIAGAVVSTAAGVLTTTTKADGTYRLDTVPVDSASTSTVVTCSAAAYITQTQTTKVAANQTATVNFTLSPG